MFHYNFKEHVKHFSSNIYGRCRLFIWIVVEFSIYLSLKKKRIKQIVFKK